MVPTASRFGKSHQTGGRFGSNPLACCLRFRVYIIGLVTWRVMGSHKWGGGVRLTHFKGLVTPRIATHERY